MKYEKRIVTYQNNRGFINLDNFLGDREKGTERNIRSGATLMMIMMKDNEDSKRWPNVCKEIPRVPGQL